MQGNVTPEARESQGRAAGGLWIVQVVTGGLLILVLGLHMIAHHFVVEGGLRNFQDVLAYISNPLIFAIEVIFLVVVAAHAVLGLRAIIVDLNPALGTLKATNWVLTVLGIGAVGYGIWLAVTLQGMAR
jgi:succinate dehydrogenase hydrophobic anchor subunit